MGENLSSILSTLRDVAGVHGSFVISDDGALLDKDLPSMFDASLFREVGPRIVRLRETFLSGGDDMDTCAIRFFEHMLFVRAMKRGYLCVLSAVGVNMPSLKMGTQLAQRRIQTELAVASASNGPISHAPDSHGAPSRAPASQKAPPPSAPAPSQRVQMYRGHPVK
jgi:predicted regulator of Ras-like GTPase activity (Roadblock/LC7/MglB family)